MDDIERVGYLTKDQFVGDITGTVETHLSGSFQPLNATLTDISGRVVGSFSATDILDRAAGDGRYALAASGGVTSFNTRTGVVTLTLADVTGTGLSKSDVGLGSVDNTSDNTKNVLSATKLTTVRTINGVAFDGTANININATDVTARVPTTRTISTSAPLSGGGDLSTDLNLSIVPASASVPGSMSAANFFKLAGVEAGATANSSDATLLSRANHTGTQAPATILTAAPSVIIGRYSGTSGVAQEITLGSGLTLNSSTGVLSASGSGGTITNFVFTNGGGFTGTVTNASTTPTLALTLDANGVGLSKLTAASAASILGATAAGNAAYLTPTQATTLLNGMGGANGTTGGIKGLVPAPAATDNVKFLKGDGTWGTPTASITGAALTKTDDTNVTLTLGGTPSTALLQATSITVNWSGVLSATRGGNGNGFFQVSGPATSTKTFTFPNANDTIACLGQAQTWTSKPTFTAAGTQFTVYDSSNTNNARFRLGNHGTYYAEQGYDWSLGAVVWYMYGSGATVTFNVDYLGNFYGGSDNTQKCGLSNRRWAVIYSGTPAIDTSDEREKQDIGPIEETWLDAWGEVDWCRYRFRDSVLKKGDGARWHVGLIAQRVHAAFAKHGIDAFEIGLCCYDEWEAIPGEPEVRDEEGTTVSPYRAPLEAGNRWGLRYVECLALEAAWQRREIARNNKRIELVELAIRSLSTQLSKD